MKCPCNYPGCATLIARPGYCEKHKRDTVKECRERYDKTTRANTPELAAAAAFRNTERWRKVRRIKLSLQPMCEDPFRDHARMGFPESAKQVHHIVPLVICHSDERAYDLANLMSVCWKCHNKIERQTKRK
jgi:5-methylcytosine-specific restriction protein A